jgi:DNA-directed RNA polymerase subunit alpha
MRIRWRGLELPSQVIRDEAVSTPTYGRFLIEPFERGFGTTVGNSLRRILLSSLEGAAVTKVKLAGANHEFTTLPGVMEDVTDIILNVKSLIVRIAGGGEKTLKVFCNEPGEVRASAIEAEAGLDVLNPDLVLATLTDKVDFLLEMWANTGRGFTTAEEHGLEEDEVGVIPVDSVYSPVTRVRYKTEDTRVGQRTNYDRLVLEIWTNGSIRPEDALVEAAKILRKHLNPFVQYSEVGDRTAATKENPLMSAAEVESDEHRSKLAMPISELELSVRASNCLESARISTVGELIQMTEADLLKVRSFGKTSLREVKRKLADLGLELGMKLEQQPDGSGNPVNAPVMVE